MLNDQEIAALIDHVLRARECAHAPYSRFKVGAAAIDDENRVFFGVNVENASYGLSLCAERAAIAAAITAGATRLRAVVLVAEGEPPATPCGACRQWFAEFATEDFQVIAANTSRQFQRFTLDRLLPAAFRLETKQP